MNIKEGINLRKELHYITFDSPVGQLGLVASSQGLVLLKFIDYTNERYGEILRYRFPQSLIEFEGEFAKEPLGQITEYFQGKRKSFTCPVDLQGTPFQIKVWQALQNIPYGSTRCYEDIARPGKWKKSHSNYSSLSPGGKQIRSPGWL